MVIRNLTKILGWRIFENMIKIITQVTGQCPLCKGTGIMTLAHPITDTLKQEIVNIYYMCLKNGASSIKIKQRLANICHVTINTITVWIRQYRRSIPEQEQTILNILARL